MEFLKKLTSKGVLAVVLVFIFTLFCLLFYAVSRDAEIHFSKISKKGVFEIIPKGSDRIRELEEELGKSVSLVKYDKLKKQYQQLSDKNLVLDSRLKRFLAASGVDVSDGEEVATRKLVFLAARSREIERDIHVSLSLIRVEIARGRAINTNSCDMDDVTRGLYMDIQKFFRCVGIYNGEINGDQVDTCNTVREFQSKYGLEEDAIIGRKTFIAMEQAFEEAKTY
ncbi:MAG: peptidoglycan-binding protein [Planctomycetes bacterium]|nr:peptidoglycan-binding protein [Planctomycetota bacterium]MCK5473268.1 peptidoglycan-binding protein [Planctomycetota bacterium]